MVDDNKSEDLSAVLFNKTLPKMSKDGSRLVGSLKVEVKTFEGYKFLQLTQVKEAFGIAGTDGYRPQKVSWVTLDPSNKEVIETLEAAFKI